MSAPFGFTRVWTAKVIVGLTLQDDQCNTIDRIPALRAQRAVEKELLRFFPFGSTRIRSKGIYNCLPHNVPIREDSLLVEVLAEDVGVDVPSEFSRQVVDFAQVLARAFRQQAVLVQITAPTGQQCVSFVPAEGNLRRGALMSCVLGAS